MNYVLGLDLGQAADPSALCLLEQEGQRLAVRNLKRYALGTGYPPIVSDVCKVCEREPLKDTVSLVVDASGCGRPVMDLFAAEKQAGALKVGELLGVTITGGNSETVEWERGLRYWRVAKRILVSALQIPLQGGRLQIADQKEARLLTQEMMNFQVKINDNATDIYAAREGMHDDLVLATALAVWWAGTPRHVSMWSEFA